MKFELMMQTSVPVWLVTDVDSKPKIGAAWDSELYPQVDAAVFESRPPPVFRGVSPDRLLTVLSSGVDVEPADSPIYCSDFDKAWEYGGPSMGKGLRLIYALDSTKLDRTFRTLPLDATDSEIAKVRETFPHQHQQDDCLWFSRINRYFPGYEIPYGYWVPGNAKDALLGVFLLGGDQWRDLPNVLMEMAKGVNAKTQGA